MIRCLAGRGLACLAAIVLSLPGAPPARAQFTKDRCLGSKLLPVLAGGTNGLESVVVGDLNADGFPDLVTASFGDDRITWFESEGYEDTGETEIDFMPTTISAEADGAISVVIADLDDSCHGTSGISCLDVISASSYDNKISWYVNNGGDPPGFTEIEISTGAALAQDVFAADLDGDCDDGVSAPCIDVISASFQDNKIAWYRNDGRSPAPGFTEEVISTDAWGAKSVFAADLDGDGDDDVIAASLLADEVAWFKNLGSPAAGEPLVFTRHVISSADLDPGAPSETIRPTSVYAADLNGDGAQDIAVASNGDGDTTGKISWFESDGAIAPAEPTFTSHEILPTMAGASEVFVADVNGDGPLDVVAAYGDTVTWFENDGAIAPAVPTFTPHIVPVSVLGAMSVFAADLNGDDFVDLQSASSVPGRVLMDDLVAWYPSDGIMPPEFALQEDVSRNAQSPEAIVTADIDDDGLTDVVSASSVDDTIAWERNEGGQTPSFALYVIAKNAENAVSVFAADLNGDCDETVLGVPCQDVIVAAPGDGTNGKISWFENLGATDPPDPNRPVEFKEHVILEGMPDPDPPIESEDPPTSLNAAPMSVFAADLDSDGDTDVIGAVRVEADVPDEIVWFENPGVQEPDGSLAFTERVISTNVEGPRSVFAADVDSDGDIDVLSASTDDDKISLYRNDGETPPGFVEVVVSTEELGAMSVSAADIDGDCDELNPTPCVEILSASSRNDTIALFQIAFEPPAAEPASGVAGGGSAETPAGTGETGPMIEVLPGSLDFGGVFRTRVETATLPVQITNSGTAPLDISSITSSAPEFTPSETSLTIPAGLSASIDVAFEPSGVTTFTGTLDFTSNAVNEPPPSVSLAGSGLDFGVSDIATDARFARFVSSGDVNNDGLRDILSASSGDRTIAAYLQQETEPITFEKLVVTDRAFDARSALARDLNGDGWTDVVAAFFFEVTWQQGGIEERCNSFDVDTDTRMGGTELGWFYAGFGKKPTDEGYAWVEAIDYDQSGEVDGDDLAILSSSGVFGKFTMPDTGEPAGPLCDYSCVAQE